MVRPDFDQPADNRLGCGFKTEAAFSGVTSTQKFVSGHPDHARFFQIFLPGLHGSCFSYAFFRVIDQATFNRLLPRAYAWAKAQEDFILARGTPLGQRYTVDAQRAGVQNCERVRILVVDRMSNVGNSGLLSKLSAVDAGGVEQAFPEFFRQSRAFYR